MANIELILVNYIDLIKNSPIQGQSKIGGAHLRHVGIALHVC